MRTAFLILFAFALVVGLLAGVAPVRADVIARIDLAEQRMIVQVDGVTRHEWKVSTARPGYRTPTGSFAPTRMYRRYRSVRYDNAPMPYSVFFYKGYAVHGTTDIGNLGRPASHGCVRLHPDHARVLFELIQEHGLESAQIVVLG